MKLTIFPPHFPLLLSLATPLDVVRVRLQSQGLTRPPRVGFPKFSVPGSGATFRPADLGVTACCREVFFTTNNTEICLAGPRIPINGTSGMGVASPGGTGAAAAAIGCAVEESQQRTINSTLDGLRKIARNEGVATLWRGLSPTLVMAIPANIIYFTGYDWLRYNPASPIIRANLVRDEYTPLVAGSVARVLAATAVCPIELFRTRLQAARGFPTAAGSASSSSSRGSLLLETFRGIQNSVRTHGYRALWRGLTLTLLRDVPFSAMYWWGYETIRDRLAEARERKQAHLGRDRNSSTSNHAETFTDSFIAGMTSGGIASVATMPFDVGKTRTQVFRDAAAASSSSSSSGSSATAATPAAGAEQRNMARLLWHIFRTEGLPGLFRGCFPRTLRVAPSCAVMISSYEVGKRVFREVNERAALAQRAERRLGEGEEAVPREP